MDIVLTDVSNGPVYLQVRQQIESFIKERNLLSGEALPSPLTLAQKLLVDKGEIQRAYFELEQAGLVVRKSVKDFLGKTKTSYSIR
jgi:GntR family transcriptional regulator